MELKKKKIKPEFPGRPNLKWIVSEETFLDGLGSWHGGTSGSETIGSTRGRRLGEDILLVQRIMD